jgi:hypothetical protein
MSDSPYKIYAAAEWLLRLAATPVPFTQPLQGPVSAVPVQGGRGHSPLEPTATHRYPLDKFRSERERACCWRRPRLAVPADRVTPDCHPSEGEAENK